MPSAYYNFSRILSHQCALNFIPGIRGVGKTFGAKKLAINDALRNGKEFIYMRRYQEELDESRRLFFDDIAHLWPKYEFMTNRRDALASPRMVQGEKESDAAFTKRKKERVWTRIGMFIALSVAQRYKSTPFPNVRTIIIDEFILEDGPQHYLKNEAQLVVNFYNTVDRSNDRVRVLLLANAVSINNPYFVKWKIRPGTPGVIQLLNKDDTGRAFIAVDFPDSKAFATEVYETRFGKFIQGTEYADYAVGNIFSDNGENLIKVKDSTAEYVFTLETRTDQISVWILRKPGQRTEYFMQSRQPAVMKIMTLDPDKMDENRMYLATNDSISQILRGAYRQALCWFDAPETRNTFIEIFVK